MQARLKLIEETLLSVSQAVGKLHDGRSDYSDVKGYLAQADLVAHQTICLEIGRAFPDEPILSEEGDGQAFSSGALWITDPLCGTTNYVRGIPLFTHSLCFVENRSVVAAGIYHPALNEMFLATSSGSTLNGQKIYVSQTRDLDEAIVSLNCNQATRDADRVLRALLSVFSPPTTRRIRVIESANLELAWLACGRIDVYVNPQDKVWDFAAGSLLISAAGGVARTVQGTLASPASCRGVVATNRPLQSVVDQALTAMVIQ